MNKLTGTHITIIACTASAVLGALIFTGKLEVTQDLLKQLVELVGAFAVGLHMKRPGYMEAKS